MVEAVERTANELSRRPLLVPVGLVLEHLLQDREHELAGRVLEDLEDGLDNWEGASDEERRLVRRGISLVMASAAR